MDLANIIAPIASVLAIFAVRMMELRTRRETVSGPVRERLTLRLFLLAGALMLVGSITEFFLRGNRLEWFTFVAGWASALASFVIRRRAIAALGKFWSLHVEIREHHEFVQSGPFRWMRHPTYFSMILELVSGALILNAYFTLAAIALLYVPALLLRLSLEEKALVEKFGAAYEDYQRRTPALFPIKWPSPR